MSNRLADFLAQPDNEPLDFVDDEFDRLIDREQLRISRFVSIPELDLALFILSNRRVISQSLSVYPSLANASNEALNEYTISPSGIHWPAIDADLSLRGLLMSEVLKATTVAS